MSVATITKRFVVFGAAMMALLTPNTVQAISFDELVSSFSVLETVAGTATITSRAANGWQADMEGGAAVDAELSRPHMAMADWNGNVYIADKDAHAIRKVTSDGTIHTVAGTNVAGFNGDGVGTDVDLNQPNGLYTFPNGTTYILDLGNSMIRRLGIDGNLETIVEDPFGMTVGRGLWVSPDQSTIYYSSGTEVRRWTEEEGVTVHAAQFGSLGNLTVDPADGNVVATDRGQHEVYKILSNGSRQHIAGNGDTSGGGSNLPALQVALKEVRGIHYHHEGGYFLATHDGGQVWFVDDDDVIHLLIDGDDDDTHAGDGLPLTAPGRKVSEPRAVTLSPNGDLIVTEHDGGYIRLVKSVDPLKMGDFDQDRELGELDIDRLSAAVRNGTHPQDMDLDFDGRVTDKDRDVWVEEIRETFYGDADFSGFFTTSDLVQVLSRGQYEAGDGSSVGWSDGDFNGDGIVGSADLVIALGRGCYEGSCGPQPLVAVAVVPEPSTCFLLLVGMLVILVRRH